MNPTRPGLRSSCRARGFSLIELMVVVFVLALLIAMGWLFLGGARERALDVRCAANIRNLGTGLILAAADRHNRIPRLGSILVGRWWQVQNSRGEDAPDDPSEWLIRRSVVFPYLNGSVDVFTCPIFDRETPQKAAFSYTINWNLGEGKGYESEEVTHFGRVINPAELMIFGEENPWYHGWDGTGPRDFSRSGHYSVVSMNDGFMVAPQWPNRDTLWPNRLSARWRGGGESDTSRTAPRDRVQPYVPQSHAEARMNTGVSSVFFVDGHVEFVETTDTQRVSINTPSEVWERYERVDP